VLQNAIGANRCRLVFRHLSCSTDSHVGITRSNLSLAFLLTKLDARPVAV
jgi:hypothetical protein